MSSVSRPSQEAVTGWYTEFRKVARVWEGCARGHQRCLIRRYAQEWDPVMVSQREPHYVEEVNSKRNHDACTRGPCRRFRVPSRQAPLATARRTLALASRTASAHWRMLSGCLAKAWLSLPAVSRRVKGLKPWNFQRQQMEMPECLSVSQRRIVDVG